MSIDLLDAAQTAVFTALRERVPAELGPVYQHVKQDTPPPFIVVGEIQQDASDEKGFGLDVFGVEIHCIYRGQGRSHLLQMMTAVREALEGRELEAPGADFETPRFVGATASSVGPDGVTYAGISNFEFYGEGE